MKNGCCVDKACNKKTCMNLPQGKTCGSCIYSEYCKKLTGKNFCNSNISCDWFPRRYKESK